MTTAKPKSTMTGTELGERLLLSVREMKASQGTDVYPPGNRHAPKIRPVEEPATAMALGILDLSSVCSIVAA